MLADLTFVLIGVRQVKEQIIMQVKATDYTMIDVSYVPGNRAKADCYQVVLSRGGVNGTRDQGVVTMETDALESFLERARALLVRNAHNQAL